MVGLYAVSVALLVGGLSLHGGHYADSAFVNGYLITQLVLAIVLLAASRTLLEPTAIGMRRPRMRRPVLLLPAGLLAAAAVLAWVLARLALPEAGSTDPGLTLRNALTAMLVGFTEEWMYRGLLLAFLCRRYGLRRGALAALLLFGILHLVNLGAGLSLVAALNQVLVATLVGAVYLVTAADWLVLIVVDAAIALGVVSLIVIWRSRLKEPYPD